MINSLFRGSFAVAIVALAVFGLASALTASAAPKTDHVTGSARFEAADAHVRIEAHSDADGANPSGQFTLVQGSDTYEGVVDCLRVSGNKAVAGGTIVSSTVPSAVGLRFNQVTIDMGSPGSLDQSQTYIGNAFVGCNLSLGAGFTADQGNYVVKDN